MSKSVITRRDAIVGAVTTAAGVAVFSAAGAQQPHMESALASLEAALEQLQVAAHDKGGHRVNAIGLVQQAIHEVKRGIEAGAA